MTEKMPQKIKNDPIYSKIWNDIYRKEMNATFLVLGGVGKGKSTSTIKLASDLDENFGIERICFSIEQMLKLVNEGDSKGFLKKGSAIILDEAAGSDEAADSRNAMSRMNKTISFFTTISRQKGLIIFYVTPLLSQLDKRVRLIGVTGIIVLKEIDRTINKARTIFYFTYASALSDKVMMPKPRVKYNGKWVLLDPYWISKPIDEDLISKYRALKDSFINSSTNKWQKDISDAREKKEKKTQKIDIVGIAKIIMAEKEKFIVKDKINIALIQERFDLGMDSATSVRRYIDAKGWVG